MSKIYGLFGGTHNATVAYIEDGKIINVIEEERIIRIKSGNDYARCPELSLDKMREITKVPIESADYVMWALARPIKFSETIKNKNQELVSHHLSHAMGAYFTSNMKGKTLVVSTDGGGSSAFGRYYLAEDGKMRQIHKSNMFKASTGQFYGWITEMLGWKMLKDEGKVVGLAGHGHFDDKIYKSLQKCLYHYNLDFYPSGNIPMIQYTCNMLEKERKSLSDDMERKILAYNAQLVFEEAILDLLNTLHKQYPEYTNLVVAGGPFANVKLNQRINELHWVKEMYVYPPMGDDGLALGAAIKKAVELGEIKVPFRFKNMFLGVSYSNNEILNEAKKYLGLKYTKYKAKSVANLINDGAIVGFFKGQFEHGPRALGARSILVRPTDTDTHEKLNERLRRHEIMPFAPVVLYEYSDDIFYNSKKSNYTAEFMTLCYTTKPKWSNRIPAVVHSVDNSARPQYVKKENNPLFYDIVEEYYYLSGIPLLLNTSFNGHGEPIVNSPKEAFDHLNKGTIDFLVIEDYTFWR